MNKTMKVVVPSIVAWLTATCVEGSSSSAETRQKRMAMDVSNGGYMRRAAMPNSNATGSLDFDPFLNLERFKQKQAAENLKRKKRAAARREKAKEVLKKIPQPKERDLKRVSPEQFKEMTQKQQDRGLNWFGGSGSSQAYSSSVLADPSQYYDKWAQAYRMLGGFIDCDHNKDGGDSHDSGDDGDDDGSGKCSRWMMWASVS
jgi:hypothetical protein